MAEYQSVKEQYFDWLSASVNSEFLPELVRVLDEAEEYCLSKGIISQPFFSVTDAAIVLKNIKAFNTDRDFRYLFHRNLTKINSLLQFYIKFLKCSPNISAQKITAEPKTAEVPPRDEPPASLTADEEARYDCVLEKYFKEDGYQLGRPIFRRRFRDRYSSEYGHEPEHSNEQIEALLCKIGSVRDGRVFSISGGEQGALVGEIMSDINSAFDAGASAVYPSAVFERYRERLAGELHIYTEEPLTSLILENSCGKLCLKHSHLVFVGRESNPTEDIRRIMQESHSPMTVEEIHDIAWYIPIERIKNLLAAESRFVCVTTGTYYYAPNFPISEDEEKTLISAIGSQIDCYGYITDVELMNIISENCAGLEINTAGLSRCGIRNCLGYIMRNQFAFNGPIITRRGCKINRIEVFRRFAAERQRLTYSELKEFAEEMETGIYWDAVLSEMVRLNENDLIRKDEFSPDITAIDNYLDGICTGEYLPLSEINLFLSFPNVGHRWNNFLLESYLYLFSRQFRLVHNCFAEKATCGAMVRVNSKISDYEALITDVLSKAGEFTAKTALDYLVEHGYQAKRSYKGIENVLRMVANKALQNQ